MDRIILKKPIKNSEKCRCCIKPVGQLMELSSSAKNICNDEKSFKEILNEITNKLYTNITDEETKMPQNICKKCATQIKVCYKFILQIEEVSKMYLELTPPPSDDANDDDVKILKCLQETPIEIPTEEFLNTPQTEDLLNSDIKTESQMPAEDDEMKVFVNVEAMLSEKEVKLEDNECSLKLAVTTNSEKANADKTKADNVNAVKSPTNPKEDCLPLPVIHKDFSSSSASSGSEHSDNDADYEDEAENNEKDDFKMHSNEPIATPCDICHKIYESERKMRVHRRYSHMPDEQKKSCPICTYKCSRISNLKAHMAHIHGAETVDKHFTKMETNLLHKYSCTLGCNKKYRSKDGLRRHNQKYHKNGEAITPAEKKSSTDKPKNTERFLCTVCGVNLGSKFSLEHHVSVHSDERPFTCEICQKTFKRARDLKYHTKTHSDYNPYQCTICGKGFKRRNKLTLHMVVHSDVRPYECSECFKTFKYDTVLKTHMTTHTGEKPFECKTCGEAFSLRTSLNNHCTKFGHEKRRKIEKH